MGVVFVLYNIVLLFMHMYVFANVKTTKNDRVHIKKQIKSRRFMPTFQNVSLARTADLQSL